MSTPNIVKSLILIVLLLTQSSVFAYQNFERKYEHRQDEQMHQIKRGFKQGHLNFSELKQLIIAHHELDSLSSRFKKDGHYGKKERRILRKKQDHLDELINTIISRPGHNSYRDRHDFGGHFNKWRKRS